MNKQTIAQGALCALKDRKQNQWCDITLASGIKTLKLNIDLAYS